MGKKYPFYTTMQIKQEKWFPHFQYISKEYSHFALLESGRGGKYSMIGLEPVAILNGKNGQLEISHADVKTTLTGNPLMLTRNWMRQVELETQTFQIFKGEQSGI
jgi:para-aminobenzoate synthetase component 1